MCGRAVRTGTLQQVPAEPSWGGETVQVDPEGGADRSVVEVKRSDRIISVKLETEGVMTNVLVVLTHKFTVRWKRKRNCGAS